MSKILIEAQKEYIELLEKSYTRTFSLAHHLHGYEEDKESIDKGIELRNKISEALSLHQQQQRTAEEAANIITDEVIKKFEFTKGIVEWHQIRYELIQAFLSGTNFKSKEEVPEAVINKRDYIIWLKGLMYGSSDETVKNIYENIITDTEKIW